MLTYVAQHAVVFFLPWLSTEQFGHNFVFRSKNRVRIVVLAERHVDPAKAAQGVSVGELRIR